MFLGFLLGLCFVFGLGFSVGNNFRGFFLFLGSGRLGRGELRRDRFQLVLAHVFVHLAPSGVDARFGQPAVDRVAVLDGAAGLATGATNGLGFLFGLGFFFCRIFEAKVLVDLVAGPESKKGDNKKYSRDHAADFRIFAKSVGAVSRSTAL